MRRPLLFLPLLHLLLLSARVFAATYYVDPATGNDANAGTTTGSPWKTIPGTRNAEDTGAYAANWGGFSSSSRLPIGTIIRIKGGSVFDSSLSIGPLMINAFSSSVYTDGATSYGGGVKFISDQSWGSGSVIFDGTSVSNSIAMVVSQLDGVMWDGSITDGFVFRNCPRQGIQFKEKASGNVTNYYCSVFNWSGWTNGTAIPDDPSGAGSGHLNFRNCDTFTVSNVMILGGAQFINGVIMGDSHKWARNGTLTKFDITNLRGDLANNDSGIGVKTLNGSNLSITDGKSYQNLKGMDLGEENGDNYDISVTVNRCQVYTNGISGFGLTGHGDVYTGPVKYWINNTLIYSNRTYGINVYAPPIKVYATHNVILRNGLEGSTAENSNFRFTPQSQNTDTNKMELYLYNNVLYEGTKSELALFRWGENTNDVSLFCDYNTYVQNSGALFCQWSYANNPYVTYTFDANGPAHSSGYWYDGYGLTNTALSIGSGHHHQDANSTAMATGSSGSSYATFWASAAPTYLVASNRVGSVLSTQTWFQTFMNYDWSNTVRSVWTVGPYELVNPTNISTTFLNTDGITIADNTTGTPYPSTLNVSGLYGANVTNITLTLSNVTHTHMQDVRVALVSPSGQTNLMVMRDAPGISENNVAATSFSFIAASNSTSRIGWPTTAGMASNSPSYFTISGVSGTVTNMTVTMNGFYHTFPGDIDVGIKGPDGKFVQFLSHGFNGSDAVNNTITFDDYAATSVGSYAITDGTYRPYDNSTADDSWYSPSPATAPYATNFNYFYTNYAAGDYNSTNWQIFAQDNSPGDGGIVTNGFTVTLYTSASAPTNTALSGVTLLFSDLGTTLSAGTLLTAGTWLPMDFTGGSDPMTAPAPGGTYGTTFAGFTNRLLNGTWSLYVLDDRATNTGTIGAWGLTFATDRIPSGSQFGQGRSILDAVYWYFYRHR